MSSDPAGSFCHQSLDPPRGSIEKPSCETNPFLPYPSSLKWATSLTDSEMSPRYLQADWFSTSTLGTNKELAISGIMRAPTASKELSGNQWCHTSLPLMSSVIFSAKFVNLFSLLFLQWSWARPRKQFQYRPGWGTQCGWIAASGSTPPHLCQGLGLLLSGATSSEGKDGWFWLMTARQTTWLMKMKGPLWTLMRCTRGGMHLSSCKKLKSITLGCIFAQCTCHTFLRRWRWSSRL